MPPDNRDLIMINIFMKGKILKEYKEYTSHNTKRLNISEIKEILRNLDFVNKNKI